MKDRWPVLPTGLYDQHEGKEFIETGVSFSTCPSWPLGVSPDCLRQFGSAENFTVENRRWF